MDFIRFLIVPKILLCGLQIPPIADVAWGFLGIRQGKDPGGVQDHIFYFVCWFEGLAVYGLRVGGVGI